MPLLPFEPPPPEVTAITIATTATAATAMPPRRYRRCRLLAASDCSRSWSSRRARSAPFCPRRLVMAGQDSEQSKTPVKRGAGHATVVLGVRAEDHHLGRHLV